MTKIIMCKTGPIPDEWFENEPTYPAKNVTPLSKEMLEWIERLKDNGSDKYRPGDVVKCS